jgi:predicted kinase
VRRIEERARLGADPSDATVPVLHEQLRKAEALAPSERAVSLSHDGTRPPSEVLLPLLDRLVGLPPG